MTSPGRLASALALAALVACGREASKPASGAEGRAGSASAMPRLPPGHPPIDSAAGLPPPAEPDRGSLTWIPPEGWVGEPPSSSMRRAQYRVPGPGGDAECVVFYFGPGQGGDARSNAERWAGQFRQPDGSPSEKVMKTSNLTVGGIRVMLVEVAGIYSVGMAMGGPAPTERPESMLLGAIAEGPDANWFFKLTGPRATVAAQRAAFEGMVRSLRKGGGGR